MHYFTEKHFFRLGFRVCTDHGYYFFAVFSFTELDAVDVVETFTQVLLHSRRVTSLTDDGNNFIIGQKVEPTESSSFGF